jgi:hypothetical protein
MPSEPAAGPHPQPLSSLFLQAALYRTFSTEKKKLFGTGL